MQRKAVIAASLTAFFATLVTLGFIVAPALPITVFIMALGVFLLNSMKFNSNGFFGGYTVPKIELESEFTLDSDIVAPRRVMNVLDSCKNPSGLTAVMRRKYFALKDGADREEYSLWLSNVLGIFEMEPNYDPENIPMTVDTSQAILDKVSEIDKVRKEHAMMAEKKESSLAQFHRDKEISFIDEDAKKVLEIALARLDVEKNQLKEIS